MTHDRLISELSERALTWGAWAVVAATVFGSLL